MRHKISFDTLNSCWKQENIGFRKVSFLSVLHDKTSMESPNKHTSSPLCELTYGPWTACPK